MHVYGLKKDIVSFLEKEKAKNRTIGLVPTMGALHQGHLSLAQRATSENDITVVSIFINPTQFDNDGDLAKYPRNMKADVSLLADISKSIVVFSPSVDEIYGENVTSEHFDFDGLDKVMEGAFRAGHFEGVGTIVTLLFKTIAPNRAYFGEKDFQQLQIIRKLVAYEQLPVKIIGCPIEREPHGLAMSSRNQRLTPRARKEAALIYKTLETAKEKFGTENAKDIVDWVKAQFEQKGFLKLEYFQIADENTLTPMLKKQENTKYRAFIAVHANDVRLIDNIRLN